MTYDELYTYTKDLRVLYVEDEELVRKSTLSFLENYFISIDVCEDGQEGLEKYHKSSEEKTPYDIVLSDIHMPYLNGLQMTKKIKLNNPDQIIVFISAHNDREVLLEAINLGVYYYLLKPLDLEEFSKVISVVAKNITTSTSRDKTS